MAHKVAIAVGLLGVLLGAAGLVFALSTRAESRRLQREIDRLETLSPQLADAMAAVNLHLAQSYFAGRAENWPLAVHELARTEDALRRAGATSPVLEGEKTAVWIEGMILGPIKAMRQAGEKGDARAWEEAAERTIIGCNSCHVQFRREFIKVEWPHEPPPSLLKLGR